MHYSHEERRDQRQRLAPDQLEVVIEALTREGLDLLSSDPRRAQQCWQRIALFVSERSPGQVARLEARLGIGAGV